MNNIILVVNIKIFIIIVLCNNNAHTLTHTVLKYHRCYVENISSVTHDSKVYSLRLPAGSYLNVPTGHHLAIRAVVDGKLYKLIAWAAVN